MATDARLQGKLAFENNLAMSSCQYPIGSTLRKDWMEGWTTARNIKPQSHAGGQDAAQASNHAA